jgi:hypothetical protein
MPSSQMASRPVLRREDVATAFCSLPGDARPDSFRTRRLLPALPIELAELYPEWRAAQSRDRPGRVRAMWKRGGQII